METTVPIIVGKKGALGKSRRQIMTGTIAPPMLTARVICSEGGGW